MIGLGAGIWRGVKGLGLAGGAVALPEFDLLLLVGSSTTDQAFVGNATIGPQQQSVRKAMADAGLDLPVIVKAVGGSVVADLKANINTYMSEMLLSHGERVAVLINIGSNDIGSDAWSLVTEEKKAQIIADINIIMDRVIAAGHTPILATCHSRKGLHLLYEQWADEIYRPLINSRHPYWYAAPLAVFDYCRLYTDNKDVVDWWLPDDTHPNKAAVPMQQFTAQKIGAYAKLKPIGTKDRILIKFNGTYQAGGINALQGASTGNFTTIYNDRGEVMPGVTFGWTGTSGGANGNSRGNAGVHDITLQNYMFWNYNMYSTTPVTFTLNMGVAAAGRTGTLRAACSSTSSDRITRVTVGGSFVDVPAGNLGTPIGELPFTLDGSGVLTFVVSKSAGAYANMCGFEFLFN